MIKFFRKIRKNLISEKRFRKYLLYAVGEIILVVIGILIALQINNWNENRSENQVEKRLLKELHDNLEYNEQTLKYDIAQEYKSIHSVKQVLGILENRLPYHDSMDYHFGRSLYSPDIVLSTTAFSSIQSRGLDVISSDGLRNSSITLFDTDYKVLIARTVRLEDQFWPSSVLPLYHKYFRLNSMEGTPFNDGMDSAPVDYEAVLNDPRYHNMLKQRGGFRYQAAALKEDALGKTVKLKNQIKDYLE